MCVCLLSVQICQESALHELTLFATYVTLDATSDLTRTRCYLRCNTICWILLSNELLNLDNRLRGTVMGVVLGVTFSK